MKQLTCLTLGKEYVKAVYCHPACLTSVQSTSCRMLGWMNHKLKSRVLGEYADDILVTEKITKKPLDEGEEGE